MVKDSFWFWFQTVSAPGRWTVLTLSKRKRRAKGPGVERERGGELTPCFLLGFEKVPRCGYRGAQVVVVVLALDVDEVEEVALAARHFVLPRPPFGA